MKWNTDVSRSLRWSGVISNEASKELLARQVAARAKDGDVIGVGSGSTAFLCLRALGERLRLEAITVIAIPTSYEMAIACANLDIPVTSLINARPDWAFDGADEVDRGRRLIKGRGGAMFQEKLMMLSSPRNVIVVDTSKLVGRLGERFPVPVEVYPMAVHSAEERLYKLGSESVALRLGTTKDGPVVTEAGNFILDARFSDISDDLEVEIKKITGVIESGLFVGYDVEVLTDDTARVDG